MKRPQYEKRLSSLQARLEQLQQAFVDRQARGVVVLEGWDAAGKGGLIRRLAWSMDPRTLRVWPTGPPSARERKQHWLQRFWSRLPEAGQIAVFDRSWYGRVLVERVESLTPEDAWRRAYREIREFETQLLAEDFRLVKLFLDMTPETQLRRFVNRYNTPRKRRKLTVEDIRSRALWDSYRAAYDDMLRKTSFDGARWRRIDANDKLKSRVAGLQRIHDGLARGIDLTPPPLPDELVAFFRDAGV